MLRPDRPATSPSRRIPNRTPPVSAGKLAVLICKMRFSMLRGSVIVHPATEADCIEPTSIVWTVATPPEVRVHTRATAWGSVTASASPSVDETRQSLCPAGRNATGYGAAGPCVEDCVGRLRQMICSSGSCKIPP